MEKTALWGECDFLVQDYDQPWVRGRKYRIWGYFGFEKKRNMIPTVYRSVLFGDPRWDNRTGSIPVVYHAYEYQSTELVAVPLV
jgi:hypothetical protein